MARVGARAEQGLAGPVAALLADSPLFRYGPCSMSVNHSDPMKIKRRPRMSLVKKFTPATCATLILLALSACSANEGKVPQHGGAVAKINGSVITRPELDRAVKSLVAQNQATQTLAPELLQKATDQALDQLTSAELLYQAASKLKIQDLDQQVAERYARNKASFPNEAEYQKALKGLGMTEAEVRGAMRKEIMVNVFVEREFAAQATVSEAEAKKYYDENRERFFQKGERLKASHILVSVDQKASAQEKQQARAKAETLRKRVHDGEDFAGVAKKESTCPSSARGGELGIFGKGQMTLPFENAAFALIPGELSPVVETEFGYHIIKLTEKLPPSTEKFEDAKEKIFAFLKKSKVQQALTAFIAQLRAKAHIEKV
jgi:peptidyl-prolyl cis-trans isomerase C